MSDDPEPFFAPPPFDAVAARATLARALRELRLVERGGAFELDGRPVARARVDGATLRLELARGAARSPQWESAAATDHAQLRRFIDDLKKRVARWSDGRDD